jgi:hypothetical protein
MASEKLLSWQPRAVKDNNLHIEEIADEILVYNLQGHRVHCLNGPAARIWKLCNGRRTVKEIASHLEGDLKPAVRELVASNAITELASLGLVENWIRVPKLISRRDMTRRIGIGAAAVALPLITSIVAPTPAQAATCIPSGSGPCSTTSQCCSGLICCGNNSHGNHFKCVTSAAC